MRDKKPRPKPKAKDGPTKIAKAAGCSKGLAHRLLKRGHTPKQIADRIAENKAREAELLELPPTPVTAGMAMRRIWAL
jgi:hypothetical protein